VRGSQLSLLIASKWSQAWHRSNTSLKEILNPVFMIWFSKASMNILDLHLAVSMHSLLVRLRLGTFSGLFVCQTSHALRAWASKYIYIEEDSKARKWV